MDEYRFIVAANGAEYWRKHPDVGRSASLCSRKVGPEHQEADQREDGPVKSHDHIWCGHGSVPNSGSWKPSCSPRISCAVGSRSWSALFHSWKIRGLGRRSTPVGGKTSDRRTGYDRITTGDGATTTDGCETNDRAGSMGVFWSRQSLCVQD